MKPMLPFIFCLLAATAMLGITAAKAADEDLTSSLYLVFDPETGEFVEESDPDRVKQEHAAREPLNETAGQDALPADAGAERLSSSLPGGWIGPGIAVLLLLVGGAAWSQKRK